MDSDVSRLSAITEDDLREMSYARLSLLLRSVQRLLRTAKRGSEDERVLLAISRRATLIASGMRCCG